jgi:hypothetical protein
VASELPGIWSVFNFKVPWKLPVVDPCSESETKEVNDDIVEDALKKSFLDKLYPSNSISLPWPWSIFFDLILFEERIFSSIN